DLNTSSVCDRSIIAIVGTPEVWWSAAAVVGRRLLLCVDGSDRVRRASRAWEIPAIIAAIAGASLVVAVEDDAEDRCALERVERVLELLARRLMCGDDHHEPIHPAREQRAVGHRAHGGRVDDNEIVPLAEFRQQRLHPRHPEDLMDWCVR